MADNGWDLYAVVRSCSSTTAFATTDTDSNNKEVRMEDHFHLSYLSSLNSFENNESSFCCSDLDQNTNYRFEGLEEIYCDQPQVPLTTSYIPLLRDPSETQHPQPLLNNSSADSSSSFTFPTITNYQTIRSRRRKNHQKKMARQMTEGELSADSWSWRKYGQKPIKGSPNPRSYYRCSTLKGCKARKQVERSSMDSTIFMVSYTGEHIHPRPTHLTSVAASTRKLSAFNYKRCSCTAPKPSCSLS